MLEKGRKNGQRSLKVIDDLDVCETSNRSGPSYVCLHCTIDVDLNMLQMVQITYTFLIQFFFVQAKLLNEYLFWLSLLNWKICWIGSMSNQKSLRSSLFALFLWLLLYFLSSSITILVVGFQVRGYKIPI